MDLQERLSTYLRDALGADGPVQIQIGAGNDTAGFSSETTMYTARWTAGGVTHEQAQVLKREPTGVTVFKDTDVSRQVRAMRLVREHSDVPVPEVVAIETDPDVLGDPFYVMEAVEGQVPPDNPPLSTGGWIFDATPEQQRELHTSGLEALAGLHAIDPSHFDWLDRPEFGSPGPDQMIGQWEDMLAWGRPEGMPLPIIDQGMAWLREHQPDDAASHDLRLSWGDSRISNIIWKDFRPAAVIDWEMVELAPVMADVVWYRFIDRTMDAAAGATRLPGFLDLDGIVAHYEATSGLELTNLDWYEGFAAVRFGVIMMRMAQKFVGLYDLDPGLIHNNIGVRGLANFLGVEEPGPIDALG